MLPFNGAIIAENYQYHQLTNPERPGWKGEEIVNTTQYKQQRENTSGEGKLLLLFG